jgi:uncharacterized damage-inducible protein DinB
MKEAIPRLVAHLKWADQQVLSALRARPTPDALRWFAHVVGAERVWLLRMRGEDWTVQKVWPELTLDECEALAHENAARLDELVEKLDERELARTVTYTNSAGRTFTDSVGDILLHVALHGAHHRGQIASSLRGAGGTPPVLDYIRFVRGD